jgi:hypothetical protein
MKKRDILSIMIVSQLITACSYRDGENLFEDLYTDVKVVKPSSANYAAQKNTHASPILNEPKKSTQTPTEKKSVHIKKTGRIIQSNFDEEVKLYVYTLIDQQDGGYTIFYYDQKLNFPSSTLVDVDILDNYLITAKKHPIKSSLSVEEKKKYIKHKKRNYKIKEAIEEKIDTL